MNPFWEAWRLLTSGDLYVWNVVLRSLQISGTAIVLAALLGLPIGLAVGLSRFRFRRPLVAVIHAGLALPPVVVGLAVYLLLSGPDPVAEAGLLYSPAAVVLAQAFLAGPYIAAISLAAAESVPPDVRLEARALGAGRVRALLLHLREARSLLTAAVAAGFGVIIGEVGAVLIVGGNILGETRVMSTAIVLETRRGNLGIAVALGVVLLLIALYVNFLLLLMGDRPPAGRGPGDRGPGGGPLRRPLTS